MIIIVSRNCNTREGVGPSRNEISYFFVHLAKHVRRAVGFAYAALITSIPESYRVSLAKRASTVAKHAHYRAWGASPL